MQVWHFAVAPSLRVARGLLGHQPGLGSGAPLWGRGGQAYRGLRA